MAKKIYLSPSNQNANVYSFGNTNEMIQCNRIADKAQVALKRCGFEVKKAKEGQEMYTSIKESNDWGADLHVPIHTNAYNGKLTGGTLVMLYANRDENNKAGRAVLDAVAPISPGKDYTLRYNPELAELNGTNAVAVYLEVEFHDTAEGAKWIIENVEVVGEALANGICNYFGVEYILPADEKVNFETAAVQVLLRNAHKLGFVKTYVNPVDNKKGKLTNGAIKEAKEYFGFKNIDTSITAELINALDELFAVEALCDCLVGDVNGDGKVDIRDATEIQKKVAGLN